MNNIADQWRKVTRVIGTTIMDLGDNHYGLPDLFYGERIRAIREKNLFESQGDLRKMRYSEIRLPQNDAFRKSLQAVAVGSPTARSANSGRPLNRALYQ